MYARRKCLVPFMPNATVTNRRPPSTVDARGPACYLLVS